MSDDKISYESIDEADLIHGLYHGTQAMGMGFLHNRPSLTVEQVREQFAEQIAANDLYIDYFCGRPLKTRIDTKAKTLTYRLYDRDAGQGACQRIVDRLRGK